MAKKKKRCLWCGATLPEETEVCPACGKTLGITDEMADLVREGYAPAVEELYRCTRDTLQERILSKVPDPDMAEELLQEVYLRAFTHLGGVPAARDLVQWLDQIAMYIVTAYYSEGRYGENTLKFSEIDRNGRTVLTEDDLLGEEIRISHLPAAALDRAETTRVVTEILDALPEEQRTVLVMHSYEEMTYQEIAAELGIPEATVKARAAAGMQQVEHRLRALGREES